MTANPAPAGNVPPPPLRLSRFFPAPPALVFKAWTSAEHVQKWFCPTAFSLPEVRVEFKVGGAFDVCMEAPDGLRNMMRGRFLEIDEPRRLVLEGVVNGPDGTSLFRAETTATFTAVPAGTQLDIVQSYTILNPNMTAAMMAGAPVGWSQTLDKLRLVVAALGGGHDANRQAAHGTFRLERRYPVAVARVYAALTEPEAKARWFIGPAGWEALMRFMDVRPGGRECAQGRFPDGTLTTFDAVYFDVIPQSRLVYGYEMHVNDRRISVSLATMELFTDGPSATRLVVTEQGTFLDGYDDAGAREQGTAGLLDQLGASLIS